MNQGSTAQQFWGAVKDVLHSHIPSADFFGWFAMAEPLSFDGDTLVLSFANDFAADFVAQKFHDVLHEIVAGVAGRPIEVRCVSRETPVHQAGPVPGSGDSVADTMTEDELRRHVTPAAAQPTGVASIVRETRPSIVNPTPLNPRYRFDTFVIGGGNQVAHAAALSVAEAPGQSYNPLFIYGGTGLGKTHLLHAIGHYAQQTRPGVSVAYVTTEDFINRLIDAIQRRDTARERFKAYFRGIDILLMDDVQFLSGKSASMQEELFHTFNALHESGRQVVLTSDREPGSIPQLEERLRSRFAWGLITDIARPDHATRVAILRKKARFDGLEVPDDVVDQIAARIANNVRELEGALTRIVGYASLTGRPITTGLADQVLDSYIATTPQPVTIDRIQAIVCEHFSLTKDDLVGSRRSNEVVIPRQIAMYLARVLLGAPSTKVGQSFGGRDHSTVLHAEKKIDRLVREDSETYDLVAELTAIIRQGAGSVASTR